MEPRARYDWIKGNVRTLFYSAILSGFTSGLIYGYSSNYLEALGASVIVIGLMNSASSIIRAIVSIPGAVIADRYGRRRIIVVFTFVASFNLLLYVFAFDWRMIFAGMLIYSINGIYHPALLAIEADSIPEDKRGEAYSLVNLLPGLASGLSPPIAGYIIAKSNLVTGMRINYFLAFLGVLGVALLRYYRLEETLIIEPEESEDFWEETKTGLKSLFDVWKEIPANLWTFLVIRLLKASLTPFFGIYISLYVLNVLEVGVVEWGIIGSSYLMLGLFLGVPLGKLLDKIGRWKGMLLSFLFSLPFLVFMTWADGFPMIMGLFLVRTVGQLLWYPAVGAIQADLIPVEKRGRIIGLSGFLMDGVMVISATLFAVLYNINPSNAFILAILVELLCVVLIITQLSARGS